MVEYSNIEMSFLPNGINKFYVLQIEVLVGHISSLRIRMR